MKERISVLIWCAPLLFLLSLLTLLPSLNSIYTSFTNASILGTESKFIAFHNYIKIITSHNFIVSLINTIIYVFTSVVFQLVAGLVLALLINQRLRGIRIFRICVLFPYLVPTVVAVYTYKWLLDPSLGVYTYILDAIGVSISPFATGTAMATVILITFWKYVPFAAIMILARLMVIPKDLQEAAEIDGASPLSKVRYIILPQLKYVLMATALLRTIWLFREFDIIWLTTGGGPLHATETLPVVAYIYAFQTYDLGLGSAVAVILFIIVFIFTIAYLKVSERL